MIRVPALSPDQVRRIHEYYRLQETGWTLCSERMPKHEDALVVGSERRRDTTDDVDYNDSHLVIILTATGEPQTVIGSVNFEGGGVFKAWCRILPESWAD